MSQYFNCVFYPDNVITSELAFVNSLRTEAFVYALHNLDEGKKPHFHLIVKVNEDFTPSMLRARAVGNIHYDGNLLVQRCKSLADSFDYLTHKASRGKVHYTDDILRFSPGTDIAEWLEYAREDSEKSRDDKLLEFLLSPNFNLIRGAEIFGRDFIFNAERLLRFRALALVGTDYVGKWDVQLQEIKDLDDKGLIELTENQSVDLIFKQHKNSDGMKIK